MSVTFNKLCMELEQAMEQGSEKARQRAKAQRKIFTDENVLTLPLKRKQYMVWDGGHGRGSGPCVRGLSVLVSPAGARSYRSTYYFPNSSKPHSRDLGRVGQIKLDEARERCRMDRENAKNGIDPKGDHSKSDAYAEVVEEYIRREQIGTRQNISHVEVKRMLLKHCPDWHMRSVGTITSPEIQKLLERVRDGDAEKGIKPTPYLANSLRGRLNNFFSWCAKPSIGKIKSSPMIGIDKPFYGEKRRERNWFRGTAADHAIKVLWAAADEIGGTDGAYLKILMLTGKRKSSLANMRWEEIDNSWFWNAPEAEQKKNKRLHSIPLPSLAQRILHPKQARGFVFPGNDKGHIYVNGMWLWSKVIKASGMDDFLPHGLRHLAETKMGELKIAPHIRDMLFDHRSARGSGEGYDHHHYKDEMRAALEQWADHIEQLVSPEGVALLR
jgi:integrase